MNDKSELCCLIQLSPQIFAKLLNLPEGAYVDYVTSPPDWNGLVNMRVRGAGWKTPLGGVLRYAVPTINSETGEIDLGLPQDDPAPHP